MKIAHISDLHICSKFKRNNISKTKKLIRHALEKGADHLVITGDLSDNAQEKDFLILRKILQTYKLLSSDKTSIVIGNHDIFGGVQTAHDVINFPSKCINTNYSEKVEEFVKYFEELFENAVFASKEKFFPYAKVIGDVALFGFNSIDKYSKLKNTFASNGHVAKTQREDFQNLLSNGQFADKAKIALVHHHFYKNSSESKSSESSLWNKVESFTMKLRGKKKMFNLFKENGISLVLHGHSHEIKEYTRKGIRFLNAGASVENETENEAGLFFIEVKNCEFKIGLDLLKESSLKTSIDFSEELLLPAAV